MHNAKILSAAVDMLSAMESMTLPSGYLLPEGMTMEGIRWLDLEFLASEGIEVEGLPAKDSDEGSDPKEQ